MKKYRTRYQISTCRSALGTTSLLSCILFYIKWTIKGYDIEFSKRKVSKKIDEVLKEEN